MSTEGLMGVLPRGGQMNDEFPANLANYMDGLIKKHWMKNHVVDTTLETPDDVSLFVWRSLHSPPPSELHLHCPNLVRDW